MCDTLQRSSGQRGGRAFDDQSPRGRPRGRRSSKVILAAVSSAMMLMSAPALAQANSARPPSPTGEPSGASLASAAVGLVFVSLTVFAAAFPSRRGHQD